MSVAFSSSPLLVSSSSCSTAASSSQSRSQWAQPDLHCELQIPVGPQPRPSTPSVPCRTSTTTIPASVPCRTSTTTIHAQCSLPDLNREYPRPVFPAGPQPRPSTPSVPAGPQPRVSTPKDMPHRVPEDMPDRMLEDMPDRMPEGMPDRMPDRMSARMPEDMPDKVPECLPDRMPADLPDNMPEDMLDRMPDGMPEDLPDNMPEDMPDRMPEDMPGRMPEDMPDRMPDRMPENMSDRMPEDLPVTKCINVMVGITRSKVFFLLPFNPTPSKPHSPSWLLIRFQNYDLQFYTSIVSPWYIIIPLSLVKSSYSTGGLSSIASQFGGPNVDGSPSDWSISLPGSAQHAPGRKYQNYDMATGNQWPIGKFLRCRSNEVLELWGAPTNEQRVVEMPMQWHERICSQLNEFSNEPRNPWTHKPMNQSVNESKKQWGNKEMTQSIKQPVNQ